MVWLSASNAGVMKKLLPLLALMFLAACSPRVTSSLLKSYPALGPDDNVAVYEKDAVLPGNAIFLGSLRVDDTGFTSYRNGTYGVVVEMAKAEARKAGGNALHIISHRLPDFVSSSHRIIADVLRIPDETESFEADSLILRNGETTLPSEAGFPLERDPLIVGTKEFTHWRITLEGGISYGFLPIDESLDAEIQAYEKRMRLAPKFSLDATYWPFDMIGFGLHASDFYSNGGSLPVVVTQNNGDKRYGTMSEVINILFVGPVAAYRSTNPAGRFSFVVEMGLGAMGCFENGQIAGETVYLDGWTPGGFLGLGLDWRLTRVLGVGFSFGYTGGGLRSMRVKSADKPMQKVDLPANTKMDITHLDLSVGLRLNLDKH